MESLVYLVVALLLLALTTAVTAQALASARHRAARGLSLFSAVVSGVIGANLVVSTGRVRVFGALLLANAATALLRTARRSR